MSYNKFFLSSSRLQFVAGLLFYHLKEREICCRLFNNFFYSRKVSTIKRRESHSKTTLFIFTAGPGSLAKKPQPKTQKRGFLISVCVFGCVDIKGIFRFVYGWVMRWKLLRFFPKQKWQYTLYTLYYFILYYWSIKSLKWQIWTISNENNRAVARTKNGSFPQSGNQIRRKRNQRRMKR